MTSITGILANVFVPAFFGRRGIDQTEGGVSGHSTHLFIVGATHVNSSLAAPIPSMITKEISETMGATVAIRFRPEAGRGEVSAHIVPVTWSERLKSYIVDPTDAPYYRAGGNIAVIDEIDARALRAETPSTRSPPRCPSTTALSSSRTNHHRRRSPGPRESSTTPTPQPTNFSTKPPSCSAPPV